MLGNCSLSFRVNMKLQKGTKNAYFEGAITKVHTA